MLPEHCADAETMHPLPHVPLVCNIPAMGATEIGQMLKSRVITTLL